MGIKFVWFVLLLLLALPVGAVAVSLR